DPVAFPDALLPKEDLWIDVLLSSSDFHVARWTEQLDAGASAVEARLRLPRDGGRAIAEDGWHTLRFAMRPLADAGPARARPSYLYRNTVVQSQRIDVELEPGKRLEPRVHTDFTISQRLGDALDAVPARARVTVITNER